MNAIWGTMKEVWDPQKECFIDSDVNDFDGLREAVQYLFKTRTNLGDGRELEIVKDPMGFFKFKIDLLRVRNKPEFETGCEEIRTLFIPDSITLSSRRRLAKLLGFK